MDVKKKVTQVSRFVVALSLIMFALILFCIAQEGKVPEPPKNKNKKKITITILYNNVPSNTNLTTAWGMSALIEGMEKTILFDVGGQSSILWVFAD